MKKLIVAVAVFGLCVSLAQEQANSITLRPMIGYGIGTGRMFYGQDLVFTGSIPTITPTKAENMYYSAGGGVKLGLGIDADVAEHVALGFDLGYSMGLNTETGKASGPSYTSKTEDKTSYMPISLTFKVKSKLEKITVFAGFGPTVLMLPKEIETYNSANGIVVLEYEREITFKMGLGYHGLAGLEYGLTDKMSFIAQLRADQVSIKADKRKYTKYTVDGADQLAGMTTHDKETTYLEDTAGAVTSDGTPDIAHTFTVPANSLAFSIGIGYSF